MIRKFPKFFPPHFLFHRQGFVNHIILIYKGSNAVQTPFPPRKFMFDDDQKTIHARTIGTVSLTLTY